MTDCCHVVGDAVSQLRLVDLPTDVLLYIFQFCEAVTLRNLSVTCKLFNDVTSEDYVWVKKSNNSLITNQLSQEIIRRSSKRLRAKERCRISENWKHGVYEEKIYKTNGKYMPSLYLEEKVVWISQGPNILAVERFKDGLKMKNPLLVIHSAHTEDISRFVINDDIIFSGGKDKFICGWSINLNKSVLCQPSNHTQDIQDVDVRRNILVSGSKDSSIKVWQLAEEYSPLECAMTIRVSDRIWSVAIDPSLSCIAAGSAGYRAVHPLHLYDLDRGVEKSLTKSLFKNGAAVYDIHWESPDILVTCGYDANTRLWDLRVGKCVSCWADPFGAPGYCLATDCCHSVLCGTAHHGRVQLWDKRSPVSVQAYFGSSEASSPVYSLGFDPTQLFIAQDSCVNVLDFSKHYKLNTVHNDYSTFWTRKK